MLERLLRLVVGIVVVLVLVGRRALGVRLAGFGYLLAVSQESVTPVRPDIPFAPLTDPSLHDPDNPTKVFRVDMAQGRARLPAVRAERAKLTPANLLALNQEEVDQLYGRLTAGPIPDGPYLGDLFFSRGETLRPRLEAILGGLEGRIAAEKIDLAESAGRALWKGKMFYRDERELRNFIEDFRTLRSADRRSRRAADTPPCRARAGCGTSCPRPTSGCSSRPSSTAARACSTAAASR